MTQRVVCPGDVLFPAATHSASFGTYVREDQICAAVVGTVQVVPGISTSKAKVQVARKGGQPVLPAQGDTVVCRVTKVNPRLAAVDILCVGPQALEGSFTGIIRAQDVRATEIDKVELGLCFRPGDLVRAEVLSLGDSHSYYLTTAKNELGVTEAKGLSGLPMVAISWQEMQCPETKTVEKRKVAKIA